MTRIIDWCISHDKAFGTWTDYEKWEYREQVLEGIKEKVAYVGLGVLSMIAIVFSCFLIACMR